MITSTNLHCTHFSFRHPTQASMMNSVFRVALRQFSTTVSRKGEVPAGKSQQILTEKPAECWLYYLGYKQLKERQKMFNLDNGLRVHERGGMVDGLLYNFSLLLIGVGGVLWVQTVYTLAFPKKE